jgi:hypothetical protein
MALTKLPDEFYREFDKLGEARIKDHIKKGHWTPKRRELARLYLDEKESKRALTAQAEQVLIARSTKNAAWAAIIISIISVVISAATFIKAFHIALGPWQP